MKTDRLKTEPDKPPVKSDELLIPPDEPTNNRERAEAVFEEAQRQQEKFHHENLATIPEDNSCCQCCRRPYADDRIQYLSVCAYCADQCGGSDGCRRNACSCPGGCCSEHKAGEPCFDLAKFLLGPVAGIAQEVCVACAIELVKKAAGV